MATVLIVGSGGREHALARSLVDDADVDHVVCAPGNGGTQLMDDVTNEPLTAPSEIAAFAVREGIDLVVIGPAESLVDGLADELRKRDLPVFGVGRRTAQLEGSKLSAKRFMQTQGIPTPEFRVFTHPKPALTYLDAMWAERPGQPYVIKADELCDGQGSDLVRNRAEARRALQALLTERRCGVGDHVIVEEGVRGQEASLLALTDGATLLTCPLVHVFPRANDDGAGRNTPGMGALAPAPLDDDRTYGRIEDEILLPTIDGLNAERRVRAGALDLGLMVNPKGKPYALDVNVCLGDPQTQALLALLDSDLYPILSGCVEGRLDRVDPQWRDGTAVSVVLCVEGFPEALTHQHEAISGWEDVATRPNVVVDQHGSARRHGRLVTAGGRVLTITGIGPDRETARERAYDAVRSVHFRGMRYRTDIARQTR